MPRYTLPSCTCTVMQLFEHFAFVFSILMQRQRSKVAHVFLFEDRARERSAWRRLR